MLLVQLLKQQKHVIELSPPVLWNPELELGELRIVTSPLSGDPTVRILHSVLIGW